MGAQQEIGFIVNDIAKHARRSIILEQNRLIRTIQRRNPNKPETVIAANEAMEVLRSQMRRAGLLDDNNNPINHEIG